MTTLNAHLIGRLGNQMFQYAYARALTERLGPDVELRTNSWPGQKIFEGVSEWGEWPMTTDGFRLIDGYRQCQRDLIYTRADARRWFKLKPEFEDWARHWVTAPAYAHRRVGDYASCGYVVVSMESYLMKAMSLGLCSEIYERGFSLVTEEEPWPDSDLPYPWLADFLRLMHAPILLRGNSSFSWWAAALGNGEVWSPVIDDLEGGKEQDCKFVKGNWPKMCNLDGFTDLHLAP